MPTKKDKKEGAVEAKEVHAEKVWTDRVERLTNAMATYANPVISQRWSDDAKAVARIAAILGADNGRGDTYIHQAIATLDAAERALAIPTT